MKMLIHMVLFIMILITSFLGLFGKNGQTEGRKILNQFSFRIYLKRDLLNVYSGDDGQARRLLEEKPDGSLNYRKFFDAMDGAEQKKRWFLSR